MRRVVVVSDCTDVSFGEMCGAIHREADARGRPVTVEPLVPVEHFSEINASFLTRLVAQSYPAGTVIYTLVSKSHNIRPSHDAVWGETLSGHLFIGSNFGYFGWLVRDLGLKRLYKFTDVPQSNFAGRSYLAPMVARVAGHDESHGVQQPCDESLLDDVAVAVGTVMHVDNFGNVKVMAETGTHRAGDVLRLSLNGHDLCTAQFIESQVYLQPVRGHVVLYPSTSFDTMTDVAMVRDSFAGHHGVRVGDVLTWRTV